ncbi:MAG: universal stress protein [Caldilineales bacterium]
MKILLAVGGGPHSEKVLLLGRQLIQCTNETPTVLTVARRKEDLPKSEALLQHVQAVMADLPCVATQLRFGQPAKEILAEARQGRYDLLIMGERPQHTLRARVFGPTVLEVVEHAACPVLIAKGDIRPIRRILLCESGAMTPSLHTRFTAHLADMLQGEEQIIVLHVMSQFTAWPGLPDDDLQASAEELIEDHTPEGEWLHSDLQMLTSSQVQAQAKVRHGPVIEEILAECAKTPYDLVVIGAHREAGWQRVLLENIARELIKRIPQPVLVVR